MLLMELKNQQCSGLKIWLDVERRMPLMISGAVSKVCAGRTTLAAVL